MNKKEDFIKANDEIKASEELKRKAMYKVQAGKKFKFPYKLANAMTIVLVLFGIVFITDYNKVEELVEPQVQVVKKEMNLPTVGNMKNLFDILDKQNNNNIYGYLNYTNGVVMDAVSTKTTESARQFVQDSDFSKTNVQVDGVDEADIVKTDGNYIYYISGKKIVIVSVKNEMSVVGKIEVKTTENADINPIELFISGNKLVLIANIYEHHPNTYSMYDAINSTSCFCIPMDQKTVAITYDITNKEKPEVYKEFEINGNYVSSRLINETVYLITNKIIYRYGTNTELNEKDVVQQYLDSTVGEEKYISLSDICYIPESEDNSYLNIIAFDTQNKREANINTILGAGSTIYASNNNLYVTAVKYELRGEGIEARSYAKTRVCKFSMDRMDVEFVAGCEFEGSILNQFSMDEYNGYFRVAVTEGNWNENKNSVYVFDDKLNEIGKIGDLAINEKIYAVRFIGERGFVVTFRNMDPLFVIDLKDEYNPKVVGELKIPGYSSYLHPYDENHIIGIGQDVAIKKNWYGNEYTEQIGLKLSMFDVSDSSNPIEMFNMVIGEGGSYSLAEHDHKSLLFMKNKNLMAFPITINKMEDSQTNIRDLDFKGALVIDIDLENGFSERGRITHKVIENGYKDYSYNLEINRIIYIGNDFYTLSPGMVMRNDIDNMQEQDRLEIPIDKQDELYVIY